MLGDFAGTLVFICGLIGWALLGTSLLAYAAYCITVIVTDTAAGVDEVRWPNESMIDWIGQSLRFFVLLIALLVPVGVLVRFAGEGLLGKDQLLGTLLLGAVWLWAAFPIALLSSMAANSPIVLIHPIVIVNVFRMLPSVILFYALTAVGGYAIGGLWYLTYWGHDLSLMPLAVIGSSIGLLIYSRLIGRLGWLMGNIRPPRRKRPAAAVPAKVRKRIRVSDPWAEPAEDKPVARAVPIPLPEMKPVPAAEEEVVDEFAPPTPYALGNEPPCRPPQFELIEGTQYLDVKITPAVPTPAPVAARSAVPRPSIDDGQAITMQPEDPAIPAARPAAEIVASPVDVRLSRREEVEPPTYPLFSGVYAFPFYVSSLRALFVLCVSSLALAVGMQALIAVFPRG
jgi:hypothetical protein